MKADFRKAAQRMHSRAVQLGLVTANGAQPVVDIMEELLAASHGFRNAHAYRAALEKRERPALEQENPDEAGNDYRLVEGKGCWIKMGIFSVHPYLTDEGVVVDVYGDSVEFESIASTWAHVQDAEDALYEWLGVTPDKVSEWVAEQFKQDFEAADPVTRAQWIRQFADKSKDTASH